MLIYEHEPHASDQKEGGDKAARSALLYGSSRASTRSYYVHHMQRISKAAVYFDARAIRKRVVAARVGRVRLAAVGVSGLAPMKRGELRSSPSQAPAATTY